MITVICAWCKKLIVEKDSGLPDSVSHGICERCKHDLMNNHFPSGASACDGVALADGVSNLSPLSAPGGSDYAQLVGRVNRYPKKTFFKL